MGGPKRFAWTVLPRSWALPLSVSYRPGGSNSSAWVGLLCCWFEVSWGRDFRVGPNPAAQD